MSERLLPRTPAGHILSFARLQYYRATKVDSVYAEPLFRRRLRLPNLGRDVYIELMPTLVLRVRDQRSNQVLAQSLPGEFGQLDAAVPIDHDARIEAMVADWQEPAS